MSDIGILPQVAYESGIDPVTYATVNVIEAHIVVYLAQQGRLRGEDVSALPPITRCILGDLMDAGWTPPEVAK